MWCYIQDLYRCIQHNIIISDAIELQQPFNNYCSEIINNVTICHRALDLMEDPIHTAFQNCIVEEVKVSIFYYNYVHALSPAVVYI